MILKTVLLLALLGILMTMISADELPNYLLTCNKTDPEIILCLKNSIETLRSRLVIGIPEYKIAPMDYLEIADIIVAQPQGVGLKITSHDILIRGALAFDLRNISIIEQARNYKLNLFIPYLTSEGTYKSDGRIFSFISNSRGRFTGNFTGGVGEMDIKFANKMVNGTSRLLISKLNFKLTVKNGRLRLDKVFNGRDPVLTDLINNIINDNFNLYASETIPLIAKEVARVLKKAANRILVHFTEEQLFP